MHDRIDRDYALPHDVDALAEAANTSTGHFSRAFKKSYGESPYQYVMTRRIERAMAMLRKGGMRRQARDATDQESRSTGDGRFVIVSA